MTGVEIKALRSELKLSQEQLARLVGVSFGTVNRWENDRNRPHRNQIKRLLEIKAGQNQDAGRKKPRFGTLAGQVPPIEDCYLVNEPQWVIEAIRMTNSSWLRP
jgi:putative transcriptional regulator